VAIEVRGRRTARAGHALESVNARHIRRVRRTLAAFAATTPWHRSGLRVDLVTVEPIPGRVGAWHLHRLAGIE
jgi:Holliday junction resolvase-like predicted endonuclease